MLDFNVIISIILLFYYEPVIYSIMKNQITDILYTRNAG